MGNLLVLLILANNVAREHYE